MVVGFFKTNSRRALRLGVAASFLLLATLACRNEQQVSDSSAPAPTGVAPAEPRTVARSESSSPGEYELWREGRGHWYKEEWESAAAAFRELIEQYPNSPRRCKSENYLGYCYGKLGQKRRAFDLFSQLIERGDCPSENLDDAKAERLELAYQMVGEDPSMKQALYDALNDDNIDIRLSAASWLSELEDPAGVEVFFDVLKVEEDQDRKDTAVKHIFRIGSERDKERLQELLDKEPENPKAPKMVRLIIRDLKTGSETTRINLPIGLFNLLIRSLSDDQLKLIEEEAGIDLKNFDFNLEDLPSGKVLFRVVDGDRQEIKVFLE